MKLEIIENKTKEIVMTYTDTKTIISFLIEILWTKSMQDNHRFKRSYKYNYADTQNFKFINAHTGFTHKFYNIPTTHGRIDMNKIIKEMEVK